MNKKRFNKHFDEIGRRSRVKMHKSGKNWVRTVLSQISLLRVIRGKGQAKVTLPIIETNEELRSSRLAYLQALLASGAAISGTTLALNTFAEEQVAVVEQQVDSTDTLVDKNIVVVENVLTEVVSEESVASDTGSATASEAGSVSASTSGSFSASQSASVSLSSSESASLSVSVSASTSASVSVSTSASESASTSVSMSVSSSLVEGKTSSIGAVGSENSSEPSGSKVSESSLVAVESRGALSYAPSTDLLAPTDALAQPDSTIVAMATASSEVATGLVATSLNSSSSSQSETAQMANSLDYTNLDNAIASLQHALSYPEVDATTTTASRYKRYETALKVAKAALEESLALREDSSLGQDKVDTMALIAGQAAISLTGRINQIQAAGGKFAIAEGTDVRAVTKGSAGTDVSSSGVINFRTATASNEFKAGALSTGSLTSYVSRVFYDYNADSNVLTYTITLQPKANGKIGIGIGIDSSSTFGQVTVTGATLESQLTNRVLNPGPTPKGNYYYLSNVVANQTVTFQLTVQTNGTGVNNIRLKTANINTTNNSDFGLVASNVNDPYYFINPDQRLITSNNNTKVIAAFVSGGSQTIYSKTEDAPVITDGLTDKSTSITGTGTPYSTVTLTFSNGAKTTTVVQANGTWTATPPPGAMAASTTVSAVQDTGKAFPAKDDGIQNDVLNSQENRISAATVATIRDTTRPVVAYPNQVYFFYNTPLSKDLVLATVTEVSNPDTWQKWGISRADDTGTHDNEGNLNSMLVDANGSPVSLGIRQVSGTTNQWEIYMPAGSMIAPNNFKGSNLAASEQDFFTRWPFVVDAYGNRNYLGTETENPGIKLTAVAVPSGFINKAFGETATATEIQNIAQSWTSSGRFFDGTSPAKRLTYVVQGTPPPTNVTKAVPVAVTTGEGLSTTSTVLVNYPPSFSNVSQNVYVFSGVPTTVNKQVATITETDGQTFTTQTTNAAGLTVNTSGVISTGQTFTGAVGSQTVTITATDNYNNSNSQTIVVRAYDVTGGQPMTAEVGTKVTTEAILNHVKATATGGGTAGLTGSGLDNISSYRILSGFDEHQPTLGQKTVRVRVTLTDGNYKDVDVFINYQDTIAPTVQLTSQQIYVFNGESVKILNPASPTADNPVSTKIQLATVTDATGVATTASSNGDVQNSSGSSNSRGMDVTVEGSSATSKTVYLSGTPTVGNLPNNGGPAYGWYGNYLKISDTANPANTTTYNSTDARYHLVVLGTSVATIADRDIQSPTFTRVTEQNILDAVSVDFGNASDYNNANKANIRKVLLSNTDTGTVTAGQKTAVVRVYTSTNTYKDVPVTFTYRDMTAPTATLTATSLYAFEGQALRAPIQLATLADAPNGSGLTGGQATTQIVMASSTTENGKGLTINSSGQVSGTPIAGSQGSYTNRVLVRDNAGNTGYSNSFKMYVLRANPVTATREYTGNNKFTTAEITDLIKNQIAADSRISVADLSALTYTIPDHTYAVGSQTIQATVRTPAGDTKTVPVTLNYTDTTNPTITNRKDVTIFIGKQIEMVGNSTLIPVTATDVSGVRYNLNSATFGVTVDSATGQLQGTATGSPGFNTRTVTVTDGQGRTTTSEGFRIYLIQATPTTVTREYGQTISADEIKNAITLNRGTNGSPVAVNMELLDPIPQNTDGTVRVRLTTAENVTTVVDIPVVYTNERPTIQASNQTITKNREGTPTMYDVTTGVTVRDREDDRSASDSLVTRKRYEIVNANNVVVKTVAEGAATNIDIRDLPAGNYTVKIYATDSGATNPVEGSYTLTVNADTQAPTILSSQNVSVFSGRLIEMVSGRTL
ncbi:TPA: accessory Sec-dependent serine-rich glycoprotein adhesin, partial [Streptococcus suis]|nr:accessory Sec-dependent serine-rich glycoprotein adhesin [Streptococcus suis]